MVTAFVTFLIYLIVICMVAAIILWVVGRFFPEIYPPARYIVGGLAVIILLLALLKLFDSGGGVPGLP